MAGITVESLLFEGGVAWETHFNGLWGHDDYFIAHFYPMNLLNIFVGMYQLVLKFMGKVDPQNPEKLIYWFKSIFLDFVGYPLVRKDNDSKVNLQNKLFSSHSA